MLPRSWISFTSDAFAIQAGEADKLINPGTWGQALCAWLDKELSQQKIITGGYCCEDWGWWLGVTYDSLSTGLCIYSHPDDGDQPRHWSIRIAKEHDKVWSWRQFRHRSIATEIETILHATETCLQQGPVTGLHRHDTCLW